MSEPSQPKPSRKSSTVRHTRAIQVDRSKRAPGAPPDEQIEARLKELISPAIYAQLDAYRTMGLRHRLLTLPVMVAFVLSLIWRQLGSVSEAVRGLQTEGILWVEAFKVSQQAVSQRLASFPPILFYQVLRDVLPAGVVPPAAGSDPPGAPAAPLPGHGDVVISTDTCAAASSACMLAVPRAFSTSMRAVSARSCST